MKLCRCVFQFVPVECQHAMKPICRHFSRDQENEKNFILDWLNEFQASHQIIHSTFSRINLTSAAKHPLRNYWRLLLETNWRNRNIRKIRTLSRMLWKQWRLGTLTLLYRLAPMSEDHLDLEQQKARNRSRWLDCSFLCEMRFLKEGVCFSDIMEVLFFCYESLCNRNVILVIRVREIFNLFTQYKKTASIRHVNRLLFQSFSDKFFVFSVKKSARITSS